MTSISKKILAFYTLIIILGSALAAGVYLNGNAISSTTSSLVEVDLPLMNNVSKLRFAIFAQKPILYEYYANQNKDTFQKKFTNIKSDIKAGLYMIPRDEQGQLFLSQIEFQNAQIINLAELLDETLSSSSVDWDKARDILAEVSAAENKVTPLVDSFVELNNKHVTDIGSLAQSRVQLIIQFVIGFILIILITALILGKQVNAYISKK
jgi:hypothetical protein